MSERARDIRTFYIIILTQVFSIIGSGISGFAIGIWVYAETRNATPLAMVAFFSAIPMVLASGVSGVLADRWDRRRVMAIADAGQAIGTVLLLVSFATGSFQLWHLYTVTLIQAIFGVFQMPAFTASVTMLVPDEQRDRANAIQRVTGPTSGIIAPAVAAIVYAAIGVVGAIAIDLVTFVVAVMVILSVHIPRPRQTDVGKAMQGSIWREWVGGLQYLWNCTPLLVLVLLGALLNVLINGVFVLVTPYVLARTDQNELILGAVSSAANVGGIVGAVLIGVWGGTRPRMYTLMPALCGIGIFLTLLGMSRDLAGFALTAAGVMAAAAVVDILFMSILQVKTPPDIQGRIFGAILQIMKILLPITFLVMGPLADNVFEPAVGSSWWPIVAPLVGDGAGAGMGLLLVIGGVLVVAVTLAALAMPSIRNLEAILPDYEPMAAGEPEPTPDAIREPETVPVT